MDEFISKKLLVAKFNELASKYIDGDKRQRGLAYATATDMIALADAADVQPVKHGEWDFQGYQLFKCTNCKEIFTQNQLEAMQNHIDQEEFTFPNFCPNCGADMRGDTNG